MKYESKLKENHPISKKIEKLFSVLDEMGLTIEFGPHRELFINDAESGTKYQIEDIEQHHYINYIPADWEYKITFEKNDL